MSVYDDILAWSSTLKAWQRDALRRLVTNEDLESSDLDDLTTLCFKEAAGRETDARPMAAVHLPSGATTDDVVVLGIDSVRNINALCPDASVQFERSGVTAVYGDNGSGKSGYVRVLKQVCRSRDAATPVLPDVFAEDPGGEQACRIRYGVGTEDHDYEWSPDTDGPDALSSVSIFDSGSASVYVNEEGAVAFAPLGLDLLDRLASTSAAVAARLKSRRDGLVSRMPAVPDHFADTEAGRWVRALSHTTRVEEVTQFGRFDGPPAERLVTVRRTLQEKTPRERAAALRLRAGRVRRYEDQLRTVVSGLSAERVQEIRETRTSVEALSEALRAVSADRFAGEPLAGVGTAAWRALWTAAKHFAESEAYTDYEYPLGPDDRRCVLCQQPVSDAAGVRLERFREFIADDTAVRLREARTRAQELREELTQIHLDTVSEMGLPEGMPDDLGDRVSQLLEAAQSLKGELLRWLTDGGDEPETVIPDGTVDGVQRLREAIEAEAQSLEIAGDPEGRAALEAESLELQAKKWAAGNATAIRRERRRLRRVHSLETAIASANTRAITLESNSLTETYVTQELRDGFSILMGQLRRGLRVELDATRGERGVTYHQIRLADPAGGRTLVRDVVSEGEFRTIGLAAFLAELSLAPHRCAVVFDDPVSSLDHETRERVAQFIAELAATRQVIVFTHDLFFLLALLDIAAAQQVPASSCQTLRETRGTGVRSEDLPWDALSLNKRISQLRRWIQEAIPKYQSGREEYEPAAWRIIVRFRQACERAVEELLTGGTVLRYRRGLQTQQLGRLALVTEADCAAIEALMTRYSAYIHDQRSGMTVQLPTPTELGEDVDALAELRRDFVGRWG